MLRGIISYSHKDRALCDELRTRLKGFEREDRAKFWCDHAIDAGQQWHAAIMQEVDAADIAILLLSPDFYASDFIWSHELPRMKERWQAGRLRVVPIRIRAAYAPKVALYQWLAEEQQVPRDDRAVTSYPNRDEAWREVMVEIDRTIDRALEEHDAKIGNRGNVDVALDEARTALKLAMESVRQVPEDVGGVSREDIEGALRAASAALGADAVVLMDEVASTYSRLRRCKFAREENSRLFHALADLRDQMMGVFEAARDAGFPTSAKAGIPVHHLVPRAKVAAARDELEIRLNELDTRVKVLETSRQGTTDSAATDASIDQVVQQVGQQSVLARELLAEPEIDVAGVGAAVTGAARAVTRFTRRILRFASGALRAASLSLAAAAGALVRAGGALFDEPWRDAEQLEKDLFAFSRRADGDPAPDGSRPWDTRRALPDVHSRPIDVTKAPTPLPKGSIEQAQLSNGRNLPPDPDLSERSADVSESLAELATLLAETRKSSPSEPVIHAATLTKELSQILATAAEQAVPKRRLEPESEFEKLVALVNASQAKRNLPQRSTRDGLSSLSYTRPPHQRLHFPPAVPPAPPSDPQDNEADDAAWEWLREFYGRRRPR